MVVFLNSEYSSLFSIPGNNDIVIQDNTFLACLTKYEYVTHALYKYSKTST